MANSNFYAAQTPLLDDTIDACLDYKGRPVRRSNSGGWRSASFIIAVEITERFAYYGISTSNLITYMTGPLGESTAAAAAQVNAWSGSASLLPLLDGFVADSFLGRFRTIIIASLLYVLVRCSSMAGAEVSFPLKPQEVVAVFVEQYYLALCDFPQEIYRFYQDSSMVSRPGLDDVLITFTTIADIEKHLSSFHCKQYRIVSCDSQWTFNQSLFVVVIGYFTTENDQVIKFNQSFILAPMETIHGYFISNDILKFIDEEERIPTAVSRSIQCDVSTLHIEDVSTVVSNLTEDNVSIVCIESEVLKEDVPVPLPSSTLCTEDVLSVVSNLTQDDVSTVCIEPDVPSLEEDVPVALLSSTLCAEDVSNDVFSLTQHDVLALHIEDTSTAVPETTRIKDTPTVVSSSTEHDGPTFCMEDFPAITSSSAQHILTKPNHFPKKSFLSVVQVLNASNAPFRQPPTKKPIEISLESKRNGSEGRNETMKVENAKGDETSIFVGNLGLGSKPEQLYQAFKSFGRIKPNGVQIKLDRLCRNYAFIQFESSSSAKAAIQASFIKIGDRKLNIKEKKHNY